MTFFFFFYKISLRIFMCLHILFKFRIKISIIWSADSSNTLVKLWYCQKKANVVWIVLKFVPVIKTKVDTLQINSIKWNNYCKKLKLLTNSKCQKKGTIPIEILIYLARWERCNENNICCIVHLNVNV